MVTEIDSQELQALAQENHDLKKQNRKLVKRIQALRLKQKDMANDIAYALEHTQKALDALKAGS
jgi:phage terminase small subunit